MLFKHEFSFMDCRICYHNNLLLLYLLLLQWLVSTFCSGVWASLAVTMVTRSLTQVEDQCSPSTDTRIQHFTGPWFFSCLEELVCVFCSTRGEKQSWSPSSRHFLDDLDCVNETMKRCCHTQVCGRVLVFYRLIFWLDYVVCIYTTDCKVSWDH